MQWIRLVTPAPLEALLSHRTNRRDTLKVFFSVVSNGILSNSFLSRLSGSVVSILTVNFWSKLSGVPANATVKLVERTVSTLSFSSIYHHNLK